MKKNKIYIILSVFFSLISNIFVQNAYAVFLESGDTLSTSNYEIRTFDVSGQEGNPRDVAFSNDGKKMFVVGETGKDVNEYTLSTEFNVSTAVFIDSFSVVTEDTLPTSIKFNNDGSKMFIAGRQNDKVYEYSLSINFDVSSATHTGNSIDVSSQVLVNLFGLAFNHDGTMMYVTDGKGSGGSSESVHQYSLNKSFDFSGGANFIRSADLEALHDTASGETEPFGMAFNQDGTRMFLIGTQGNDVNQYTLSEGFNISTASFDGGVNRSNNPNGIAFSPSGLRMFIIGTVHDRVKEHHLPCPFNLFAGKCPSITEGDRRGIAEAQINIAKKTIEHSTDTALNRLKWIRRNKDLQDLSFRNIKLNFSNEMLASLTEAIQVSTTPKENNKDKDVFYWAEGSLAFGKVQKTDISSRKKIYTDGITVGADKFTDDKGIKGLAFRFSQNDVKVGTAGSKLNSDTYNLTYYSTTPVENDTRFLDAIIGIGALKSNISSVLDGSKLNGNRNGRQIYGTLKLKEEIKKDNLTLIPAAQIDLGYTLLSSYSEIGKTAMRFDKQNILSRNLRLSLASVEELNNKKYKLKKHGKIEYHANLHRSSNIKYSYINDSSSGKFNTELNSGALHNINGEVGIDIIFDNNFSLFFIFEHNQALEVGNTQKVHLAIGYLPQKNTNFSFKIEGDNILKSKYIYSKNVNGLDIDFYLLNNNAMRPETFDEIALNLRKVF